jgi:hypothetical protein
MIMKLMFWFINVYKVDVLVVDVLELDVLGACQKFQTNE